MPSLSALACFRSKKPGLAMGAVGTVALRILAAALGFLMTVILARCMGIESYGVYSLALGIIVILVIPVEIGVPTLLIREVAAAQALGRWGRIRGILRFSNLLLLLTSLTLVCLVSGILFLLKGRMDPPLAVSLAIGTLLLPFVSLGAVQSASLRGFNHPVLGQISEYLIRPALMSALPCLLVFALQRKLAAWEGMGLHLGVVIIVCLLSAAMLLRKRPKDVGRAPSEYDVRGWLKSLVPLSLLAGTLVLNQQIDIVLLWFLASPSDVALYKVASLGASLVMLPLTGIGLALSPHFAALHVRGEHAGLQQAATASARAVLFLAIPAAGVLMFWSRPILSSLFGLAFQAAALPLVVLSAGQLVNSATGCVDSLLNMTGHAKDTAMGVMIASLVHTVLSACMIPSWGVVGAALGGGMSMIVLNVILVWLARKRIGIDSTALGIAPRSWKSSMVDQSLAPVESACAVGRSE